MTTARHGKRAGLQADWCYYILLQPKARRSFYDVVVLGGGPAGLTAALYLAGAGLETLVIEKAGLGGQAGSARRLANFPGFDEGIPGGEFAERLGRQARRFGVEIVQAQKVADVSPDGPALNVVTGDGSEYGARAVLLATGAYYRKLNVPGEEALIGLNIHFCATCDAMTYRDRKVLVVGGDSGALEEALFLTRFAARVDILESGPQLSAGQTLQDKVAAQRTMSVMLNHAITAYKGQDRLEAVVAQDRVGGGVKEWQYDGVFVLLGQTPNSDLVRGQVETDRAGFVVTDPALMTSMRGLFAAGDVRAGSIKQAASAAGEGATAALMIRDYLRQVE